MSEVAAPPPRSYTRRRSLAKPMRPVFDRAVLAGASERELAEQFDVEEWYARKRAAEVLARAAKGVLPAAPRRLNDDRGELTPTEFAMRVLAPRAKSERLFWRLDGRPVGARDLVRAANAVLRQENRREILYPGLTT